MESASTKPIFIPWTEANKGRRRSMSYPTPPDLKDLRKLEIFKKKLCKKS